MALSIGELVGYVDLDSSAAEKSADRIGGLFGKMGGTWGKVLGGAGLVGGGLFAASLAGAISQEPYKDKLAASLGATGAESAKLGKIAGDLYANNYGESLGEVGDAVANVERNIDGMAHASSEKVKSVTADVLNLAKAFDQDVPMATAAAGQLIRTGLVKNAKQAMDLLTKGLEGPANKADDLLETFNEYGTQFRNLGLSGKDALGLIQQGLEGGARDADIVADSLKEFSLRTQGALEQLDSKGVAHLTALGQAFYNVGFKGKRMYDLQEDLAKGGPKARAAFGKMLDGLNKIKDPLLKRSAAVALFGTQAEDMGGALNNMNLGHAAKEVGKVGGAAKQMGDTLNDNAANNIETMKRKAQQLFIDLLGNKVLPLVTTLTGFLANGLGPAFGKVSGFLSEHSRTAKILAGIIGGVLITALVAWGIAATVAAAQNVVAWVTTALASTTGAAAAERSAAQVAFSWVVMGAKSLLGAAKVAASWLIAMGPVAIVIAIVAGLVFLIIKHWDTIKKVTAKVWDWIAGKVTGAAKGIKDGVANAVSNVIGFVKSHWPLILAILTGPIGLAVLFIVRHFDQIKHAGAMVVGWIADIPGKLGSLAGRFGAAGKALLQGFIDGMKNAAGIISGIAGNVWDSVKGLLDGAITKINRALEFSISLPMGKHISINPPDIPQLATGGRATGATLAVIGEGREPESVLPDSVLHGLLQRAHDAGKASAQHGGRDAPLIGTVNQLPGEDTGVLAERVWFLTRTRG